jgi:hypothetical protein
MGYGGNKGGIGVRLVLGDTLRIAFVDCHLAAFTNATDRRNWDASEIMRRMTFEAVEKEVIGLDEHDEDTPEPAVPPQENLDKSDVILWCGDLNYRLDLPSEDIRRLLAPYMPKDLPPTHEDISTPSSPVAPQKEEKPETWLPPPPSEMHPDASPTLSGTVDSLLKHDQLLKQRKEGKAFVGFKEHPIRFLPTYKYDIGSDGTWDSSEKQRAPSWCDRILSRVRSPPQEEVEGTVKNSVETTRTGRSRSESTSSEVLFETNGEDEEEDDLVVSRGETPVTMKLDGAEESKVDLPESVPAPDDPITTLNTYSGDVVLQQLSYTSYQSVSTSDHKPVVAVFSLEFPSVLPDMRAKIHAEVAREVDKMENERRPVVTVIIDSVENDDEWEEDMLSFGEIRFGQKKRRTITIANTGTSTAVLGIVGRPSPIGDSEVIAKPWVSIEYSEDDGKKAKDGKEKVQLQPGESCQILFTICVENVEHVRQLNARDEILDEVFVLRIEEGRDVFIPLIARWMQSGFGRDVKDLIQVPEGVGGIRGWKNKGEVEGETLYSAPRELYKMTEFLLKGIEELVEKRVDPEHMEERRWFLHPGWPFVRESWVLGHEDERRKLRVGVWETLDTDREIGDEEPLYVAFAPGEDRNVRVEVLVEVVAEVLLVWLGGLPEGIVPEALWDAVYRAGGDRKLCEQVCLLIHPSIYLCSYTRIYC